MATKKKVFVAFSHARGYSSGGWGCTMIELEEGAQIRSFHDLSAIATLLKNADPSLTYSNVFVTSFLVMPSIAEGEEVSWMVTYTHGNGNVMGTGMLVAKLTGPFDLAFVLEQIKRRGTQNPVVINLQPLE